MRLIDRIRAGRYAPAEGDALVAGGSSASLADVARRVRAGADLLPAVREFLDQSGRRTDAELAALISETPTSSGSERADALLAGIAEHLAATRGLRCPRWVLEPERFLDQFWFVSETQGFRAQSLAQSPVALKRRGILWPARSLERV